MIKAMTQENQPIHAPLQYFPLPMFATAMGVTGLALVVQKVALHDLVPQPFAMWMLCFAGLLYSAIVLTYAAKLIRHFDAVKAEWLNPLRISFFPVITMTALLLSTGLLAYDTSVSFVLWTVGAVGQFILSMAIINSWINHPRYEIVHTTPAWFIPVAGNIVVPLAGVSHGMIEISWLFFTWGVLFWLILLVLVFNRLIFHPPMPQKLLPTLFILLAPPSIGCVAYVKMHGGANEVAMLLFYSAVFFFLMLMTQAKRMLAIRFSLVWWAYTFPLAAFTVALFTMYEQTSYGPFLFGAQIVAGLTFFVVAGLMYRTVIALFKGQILVPEQ